jgi:hypothetical protein
MDILGTIFLACFIALLIAAAITFGFAIITACLIITAVTTVLILLREIWRRWRFLHDSRDVPPRIIDGDYRDISNQHKE